MLGIFSKTTDSNFVEAAGFAGLDFIILDQEHGPVSLEMLHNHVRAAKISNMKAYIRVPINAPHYIGAALDTGADGIVVPNISSYKEALAAVEAARFHPHGKRGVCRFVRAANFGTKDKNAYFKDANEKTIILQVEGKKGVDALGDILSIDEFDVLFVGPYDLSQSVGYPGEVQHPEVLKLIKEIAAQVSKTKKTLGTFADNIQVAKSFRQLGFSLIAYSVDINLFTMSCFELKNQLNNNE